MAATRGTPINSASVPVRAHDVTIDEHECDRARCELVVERGGERWRVRVHFDGAVEPIRRASPPPWVARAIRRYEFQTSE